MNAVPPPEQQSLPELLGRVADDLRTLLRKEMQLAKSEIRQEVRQAGKAAGLLGGGGVAGLFTLLFLSLALAWGLAAFMWTWLAFLIVGALYGIAAAIGLAKGKEELQEVRPVPDETVETLKEDVQWAKSQMR